MASSRLPGKVLLDIEGEPMLVRVVERSRRAETVENVVVATTHHPSDDAVEALCLQRGYPCYRGSPQDVLDRYYRAARIYRAGVIVRITADCPVIDPGVIDHTVSLFLGRGKTGNDRGAAYDFAANRLPPPWSRTYPIGLDTEVCTFQALQRAWNEAGRPHQREHVMPYLYEGSPVIDSLTGQAIAVPQAESPARRPFRVLLVNHAPDYGSLRWTVDTPQDLELLRAIYARFSGRDDFSWLDVLALFEREPGLAKINAQVSHKTAYDVDKRQGN